MRPSGKKPGFRSHLDDIYRYMMRPGASEHRSRSKGEKEALRFVRIMKLSSWIMLRARLLISDGCVYAEVVRWPLTRRILIAVLDWARLP